MFGIQLMHIYFFFPLHSFSSPSYSFATHKLRSEDQVKITMALYSVYFFFCIGAAALLISQYGHAVNGMEYAYLSYASTHPLAVYNNSMCTAPTAQAIPLPPDTRLVHVQLYHRHGDRVPLGPFVSRFT